MKQLLNKKLKAGALQYTIFISVVIALLVFGFIGITYTQQKIHLKNRVFKEVLRENELAFQQIGTSNESSDQNEIETLTTKKQWGAFDLLTVTSKKGKEEITKTAFLGGTTKKDKPAVYLQEENQPLVVVGDTKIEGLAYLPKQGIKQGSIAGHSYKGNQLVYGTIQNSNSQLPKATNLERIKRFKDSILISSNWQLSDIDTSKEIVNPFSKETQLFGATETIDLRNTRLVGNCIIKSDTKVVIHESAELIDIIIIAPEIEIKEGVIGNFQAIAENKLTVGENVQLSYPTCLLVIKKKQLSNQQINNQEDTSQLVLNKNTSIKGMIGFLSENKESNYKTQLIIEENAEVIGEVYCQQNLELKGTVKGSIYTRGFIANQFGAVYKNHIYNGQILSSKLPKQYVGLHFKDSKQKVAKWLY